MLALLIRQGMQGGLKPLPPLREVIGRPGDVGGVVGYVIAASPTLPFSRGSVRLSGPDAGAAPVVDPNYFGDERDLRTLAAALRVARQIGAASASDPWRSAEATPGPAADDDDALRGFAKAAYQSYFQADPQSTRPQGSARHAQRPSPALRD